MLILGRLPAPAGAFVWAFEIDITVTVRTAAPIVFKCIIIGFLSLASFRFVFCLRPIHENTQKPSKYFAPRDPNARKKLSRFNAFGGMRSAAKMGARTRDAVN